MKKVVTESQMCGIKTFIEMFNSILEKSNYNLNQLVKENRLTVKKDMSQDLIREVKKLVNMIPDLIRDVDCNEKFWEAFKQIDDWENNYRFIEWLAGYVDTVLQPYRDTAFLREMDFDTFREMTEWCFDNCVIKNTGKKTIDESGDIKQTTIFKKAMLTLVEMAVIRNYSKDNAFFNMQRLFGIREDFFNIWWKCIEENEEKLWRIMVAKKLVETERKMDILLEAIEE